MEPKFTLIYGEPVRPSEDLLKLLRLKEEKKHFKDARHKINYLKVVIGSTNSKLAEYGYTGTKIASQHMVDHYYLQEQLAELIDRQRMKADLEEIIG